MAVQNFKSLLHIFPFFHGKLAVHWVHLPPLPSGRDASTATQDVQRYNSRRNNEIYARVKNGTSVSNFQRFGAIPPNSSLDTGLSLITYLQNLFVRIYFNIIVACRPFLGNDLANILLRRYDFWTQTIAGC